ncbi:MAG TPA: YbaB/EbfC family nucleoid-associated protein [Candidatus Brocadiia bacterium]|nr:YbaB/EbfC family nucleoid-associated protein [Candidatus Brocadiia bacterium]
MKMGAFGEWASLVRNAQRQAQEMQKKMEQIQDDLRERVVEGTAGGGMVRVLVNGQRELLKVEISKEVVNPEDIEMLQDMVLAAMNQGLKKAKEIADEAMKDVTGGMAIPGLGGLL